MHVVFVSFFSCFFYPLFIIPSRFQLVFIDFNQCVGRYQKLSEIEKEIVCTWEVARNDKPYLRKSTEGEAQMRKAFVQFSELICALRSVDFLR